MLLVCRIQYDLNSFLECVVCVSVKDQKKKNIVNIIFFIFSG